MLNESGFMYLWRLWLECVWDLMNLQLTIIDGFLVISLWQLIVVGFVFSCMKLILSSILKTDPFEVLDELFNFPF